MHCVFSCCFFALQMSFKLSHDTSTDLQEGLLVGIASQEFIVVCFKNPFGHKQLLLFSSHCLHLFCGHVQLKEVCNLLHRSLLLWLELSLELQEVCCFILGRSHVL